jgi:signal transduction histidine kinase
MKHVARWAIGRKLSFGIGAVLGVVFVVDIVSYVSLTRLIRTSDAVVGAYETLDRLDDVLLALQNAETGQRGYVITGEDGYLEPYHAARRTIQPTMARLKESFTERSEHHQLRLLDALDPLVAAKMDELDESVRLRRQAGLEASRRLVETGRGKRLMDQIRSIIGQAKEEEKARLNQKTGEVQASARTTMVIIGVGSVLGMGLLLVAGVIVYRDFAERQRAAREQARLQQSLRRSETLSAMGVLVAGVAHQVRNPLFGISSTLDAMEARLGRREEYSQYVANLRRETDRLSRLMQQLLAYGKPPGAERQTVALEDVLEEAARAVRTQAARAGVELRFGTLARHPPVLAEPARLVQAFQNLLENALEHTPAAGVVEIEIARRTENGRVWLDCAVLDPGPGIRPEEMERIFEPFYSRRQGGTGLGLSIARQIVEQHGGRVAARNRAGGGASIVVSLPVRDGVPDAARSG